MAATKYSKLQNQEIKYEADGETEVDLKHTEEQKEALIKNRMIAAALTMAVRDNNDQYCMNMVLDSKTTDWPSSQTWEIIQELQDKFAPTELMGRCRTAERARNNLHEEKCQSESAFLSDHGYRKQV